MVTTFVPSTDMRESLEVLDTPRLGKQRSEIKIILAALTGVRFKISKDEWGLELPEKRGYMNHSATRMWKGHEYQLAVMGELNCQVWADRFEHDYLAGKGWETLRDMLGWKFWLLDNGANTDLPSWWGREDVHASHRAVLLSKNPDHYAQFGWTEEPKYEYVWPV